MKGFVLNEVCATQKGVRYLATDMYDESDESPYFDYFGINLMPEEYSNNEVVVSENKLFLCNHEVMDYASEIKCYNSLSNQIPRLYIIRKFDEKCKYTRFICGFDLLDNGGAWEGITDTKHDSVSDALKIISANIGDDFSIYLEEAMRI